MRTHICGFPSIGGDRELKKALESFWKKESGWHNLIEVAHNIRRSAWKTQEKLDYVTTGDFSLYDRMLDTTLWLGAIPDRFRELPAVEPDRLYFAMARGDAGANIAALEMTKWFDTNYHYLVPEIGDEGSWLPVEHPVIADTRMALELGYRPKAAIIGPFTWLALSKSHDGGDRWKRLPQVLESYARLCAQLAGLCPLIQIEEPILCTDWLGGDVFEKFGKTYAELNSAADNRILLTTYFGSVAGNLECAIKAGCRGLHVDMVRGARDLEDVLAAIPKSMLLSLGLINGRNIWKNDYRASLGIIRHAVDRLGEDRVMLGTSCSLLHCPVDLGGEDALPDYIRKRMSFAVQKCCELKDLQEAALGRADGVVERNRQLLHEAACHPESRIEEVRVREGRLSEKDYDDAIRKEISECIRRQEELGLDVLVHGEADAGWLPSLSRNYLFATSGSGAVSVLTYS